MKLARSAASRLRSSSINMPNNLGGRSRRVMSHAHHGKYRPIAVAVIKGSPVGWMGALPKSQAVSCGVKVQLSRPAMGRRQFKAGSKFQGRKNAPS